MNEHRELIEAWRMALSRNSDYLRLSGYWALYDWYRQNKRYDQLGRHYEACGMTDLLWLQARDRPPSGIYLDAVGNLVMASHWFHLAGEIELAKAAGHRALLELDRLFQDGEFKDEMIQDGSEEYYVREMMGDAAVWIDAEMASGYYREAIRGFRTMEDYEHHAAWNESFPSHYINDMMKFFLNTDARDYIYGEKRVKFKMRQWLGTEL